jgi:hypothetical protein
MKPGGAAILFAALFLPWYTLAPTQPLHDFGVQTAWDHLVPAIPLTVCALLAVRFRAAGAVAAVIVLAAIVFAPDGDVQRDAAPWLALLGALVAAVDDPRWVSRLGVVALLGSLFAPWYDRTVFIVTRGSGGTETTSPLGGPHWGPSTSTTLVIVALGVLALWRPRFAWPAIGVVLFRMIEPNPDAGWGAYLALAGSILAWAGGLMSTRPKITDQCSPATRSSTSPASPASS